MENTLNADDREVITQSFKASNCRDFEDVIGYIPMGMYRF